MDDLRHLLKNQLHATPFRYLYASLWALKLKHIGWLGVQMG